MLHFWRAASIRRALGLANAFVVGSQSTEETLRRLDVLPADAHVHLIPPGVSHPISPPGRGERIPDYPIRFGFFGAIMPHKGVHVAIEAFRHVAPERATLDIYGDPTIEAGYTIEVKTPELPRAVRMRDQFDQSGRDEAFRSIDVLLVPSIWPETFCLVAREAMCREVPVIASRIGALAEITGHDGVLGFEAGDAAQLRALIERLIEHPDEIVDLRRRLPRVKSVAEHLFEIDRLYEALVGEQVALAPSAI